MAVTLTWIRDNFDLNKNRRIDKPENDHAKDEWDAGRITKEQYSAVLQAYFNNTLLPEYGAAAPPSTETRTVSLTEGQHKIQVSISGYDPLIATINVSSTGVTCVSVDGGACGGTRLPRISTSGRTVTTYLKEGTATTNRCTWIATKDTSKVAFISEMVLAHLMIAGADIGFVPTAFEIGQGVLIYSGLGTPASLWGC